MFTAVVLPTYTRAFFVFVLAANDPHAVTRTVWLLLFSPFAGNVYVSKSVSATPELLTPAADACVDNRTPTDPDGIAPNPLRITARFVFRSFGISFFSTPPRLRHPPDPRLNP